METTLVDLSNFLNEIWGFDFFDGDVEVDIINREDKVGSVASPDGDVLVEFKILNPEADLLNIEIEVTSHESEEDIILDTLQPKEVYYVEYREITEEEADELMNEEFVIFDGDNNAWVNTNKKTDIIGIKSYKEPNYELINGRKFYSIDKYGAYYIYISSIADYIVDDVEGFYHFVIDKKEIEGNLLDRFLIKQEYNK